MSKKKTNQPRKKKQGSDNSKKQETKQRDNQIVKNVSVKIIVIKPKSWWHIRKYYKSGHGALIVGESGPSSDDDYGFLTSQKILRMVMHTLKLKNQLITAIKNPMFVFICKKERKRDLANG